MAKPDPAASVLPAGVGLHEVAQGVLAVAALLDGAHPAPARTTTGPPVALRIDGDAAALDLDDDDAHVGHEDDDVELVVLAL